MMDRSKRDPQDKTGLYYQIWTHDYYCGGTVDGLPIVKDVHMNWYFLPWHRAFLYFHERIIQSIVGKHFRLGIWDWDASKVVPQYFLDWARQFFACMTSSGYGDYLPVSKCFLEAWLLPDGFLGGPHRLGNAHGGPHSAIHTMGELLLRNPTTAAAHPLFYAHHCNVDRFWCHWRDHQCARVIDDPGWLCYKFDFYDERGNACRIAIKDLMDIKRLGYTYPVIANPPSSLCGRTPLLGKPIAGLDPARTLVKFDIAKVQAALDAFGQRSHLVASNPMFPASFRASAVGPCIPSVGTYYYVELDNFTGYAVCGGFGQFMPAHHTSVFVVTGCFTAKQLEFIVDQPEGRVSFSWGPPGPDGTSISVVQRCPLHVLEPVQIFPPAK